MNGQVTTVVNNTKYVSQWFLYLYMRVTDTPCIQRWRDTARKTKNNLIVEKRKIRTIIQHHPKSLRDMSYIYVNVKIICLYNTQREISENVSMIRLNKGNKTKDNTTQRRVKWMLKYCLQSLYIVN